MTAGLQLGAPGIVAAPPLTDRALIGERLDVTGFVGVAPRGPIDVPTLVLSWTDYRSRFGAFEGPGLLPYAVSAFFEQGGQRAYVVRVGPAGKRPDPSTDPARALVELQYPPRDEPVCFAAADPGSWGRGLTVRLEFDASRQFPVEAPPAVSGEVGSPVPSRLVVPGAETLPNGTLLRLRGAGLPRHGMFAWVTDVSWCETSRGRRVRVAQLEAQPAHGDTAADRGEGPVRVVVVVGTLLVGDGDRSFLRTERLTDLGFDPAHPRFIANVVRTDSLLIRPVGTWAKGRVAPPDPLLLPVTSALIHDGSDIDDLIGMASFFDDRFDAADIDQQSDPFDLEAEATEDEAAHRVRGATSLARIPELGLLTVPDLYWSWVDRKPPPEVEPPKRSATFVPCVPTREPTRYQPRKAAVLLDAGTPDELDQIIARHGRLVELAEQHRRFVALLDVPQRLAVRDIAAWRGQFDSTYAAAYHPWLGVAASPTVEPGAAPSSVLVPPSAFAAGIIAARELQLGLPWGPANELAEAAVTATTDVTVEEHDALFPLGINVFRRERDGYRLTSARTLSRDRQLRQLSVRRLMTMLRLALGRQMQWVVFEPHTVGLREALRHSLLTFLGGLFRANAFAGQTEADSFFVRIDERVNPAASIGQGRLVAEVGVAPAEPLEFVVVRVVRDGDGGVRVEEANRA